MDIPKYKHPESLIGILDGFHPETGFVRSKEEWLQHYRELNSQELQNHHYSKLKYEHRVSQVADMYAHLTVVENKTPQQAIEEIEKKQEVLYDPLVIYMVKQHLKEAGKI